MPAPRPALREADVRRFVEERCFPEGARRLGAELEWFVSGEAAHPQVVAASAGPFPGGSRLTFEPGGQVELSSPACADVASLWRALAVDAAELRRRLGSIDTGLMAVGMHPDRQPRRVVRTSRYDAMELYWASGGEHDPGAGLAMMCLTAAIQVNVDASVMGGSVISGGSLDPGGRDHRWRLAHALSPVLGAAFANSPLSAGRLSGWRSSRLGVWEGLDRTRCAPALRTGRAVDDWTSYLLDAHVMFIHDGVTDERDGDHPGRDLSQQDHPLRKPFPFGRWLSEGHELGWPDEGDLGCHLSTVFPPVRAKGWLELRCMDAVDEPWWPVPIAVAAGLLDDPEAADGAARATGRAAWCWCEAPRWSLEYEPLAEAARQCFNLARDGLCRLGAPPRLIALVEAYQERFVDRGRCPADDTIDAFTAQRAPTPASAP